MTPRVEAWLLQVRDDLAMADSPSLAASMPRRATTPARRWERRSRDW